MALPDNSKRPVSRGALERVLARAAELQAARGDETEPSDSLTEAQIVELGKEVGLSPEHIRQALAEERANLTPVADLEEKGLSMRLFGAERVTAQRIVKGSASRLLETLDRWMQRDELMRVVRQRPDLLVWEPKRGLVPSLSRAFGTKDYALFRASDIAATVVPVDQGATLVRLEANFAGLRRTAAKQSVAGVLVGGAGTAALIATNFMLPIAILPVIGISAMSYAQSRNTQRHATERALLTLQLLLDRLERGESEPPSLIRMIESALPPR